MKKKLFFLILFFTSFTYINSQVYRYIPDFNFRWYLSDMGCHFSPSGDSLDITDPIVTDTNVMNCSGRGVSSIEGVQYFTNLTQLSCNFNYISSLPSTLPSNLTYLACGGNLLTSLPTLPSNLTYLSCVENSITSLPPLPSTLTQLLCRANLLTSLPALPSSLTSLWCAFNSISSLPTLPSSLNIITCDNNALSSLPPLPNSLYTIYCNNNVLTSLPELPHLLYQLHCDHNFLTSIPTLPLTLRVLECDHNPSITCLPFLPSSISYFTYDTTSLGCIPNIVAGAYYEPIASTRPLCNPYTHACTSYVSISGKAFSDADSNCVLDSFETKLLNIPIVLQKNSTVIQQVSSSSNGLYELDALPLDTYTIHIDTLNIPFYPSCLANGYDTVVIDSSTLMSTDRNYAFHCKEGFDVGTAGLVSTGIISPGSVANFDLHAGDMATIFGIHCSALSGKITIDFNLPMHYEGVMSGTLVPDTILPNRLVWNIPNFYTLDFNNAIKPNFIVDSTAQDGNLVCFSTEVSPNFGDRVPSNNLYQQCFEVFTPYDPNKKEVSPIGSISTTQDWLYYTIHFQNIGDIEAQNVYIIDIIDTNININTIQVIGSSHSQFMEVFNSNRLVRFNFNNINLPDSATSDSASHGWIQYRIKPISTITEGIRIYNNASILFDLNAPVITNTVSNLVCNSANTYYQNRTINNTQHLLVGTHIYTRTGEYIDLLTNIHGCDSIVHTSLTVVTCPSTIIQNLNFVIYNGDSIIVGTNIYYYSGIYNDTIYTSDGYCDSIIFNTNLRVITCDTLTITNQNFNIYNGDTILIGSHRYYSNGTYIDTIKTAEGYCDSIIINTILRVITCDTLTITNQNYNIYNGDTILVGSHRYYSTGTYVDTIKTVEGYCDSIIINTILRVITCDTLTITNQNFNINNGDTILVGSHRYYSNGIYFDTIKTFDEFCDSLIITTNLNVIICAPIDTFIQNFVIFEGDSISVSNHIYTTSGIYRDTIIDYYGICDSFVIITYLEIINGINIADNNTFSIVPNPANHQVQIQLENISKEPISIIDMYSRKVFESEALSTKYIVNTEAWSNGTYIIQCGNKRGKLIVNH